MKKFVIALAAGALVVGLAVGGALAGSERHAATVQACVLLPDTKSSVRWETQDRPTFIAAFKKAGVPATVVNAEGDAQRHVPNAEQTVVGHPVDRSLGRECLDARQKLGEGQPHFHAGKAGPEADVDAKSEGDMAVG